MNAADDKLNIAQKKVFIETFGCQMNILDSELVTNKLLSQGYTFVKEQELANIVLYNTCSVRDLSEQKVFSRVGVLRGQKAQNKNLVVGILGCMAERTGDELVKKNPHIDFVCGPSKIDTVPELIKNSLKNKLSNKLQLSNFASRKGLKSTLYYDNLEELDNFRLQNTNIKNSKQAFIRITRGCNKFCHFCVVPRTRGPEVHRHPNSIIEEAKKLADLGVKEITLLGQTINHYNHSENGGKSTSFAELLFNLHESIPNVPRIRFLTSYPRDFTDETLDVMAQCDRICKYLHVPAQSGSNAVLKSMNRGYTLEQYLDFIDRARGKMPNISILGDMIVGFPTETDHDFELSLQLLKRVLYKNIFVFKYSPRPSTFAFKKYQSEIIDEVKKTRNKIMLNVQHEISLHHHQKMVGETVNILIEGKAKINHAPDKLSSNLIQIKTNNINSATQMIGRTEGDHIVIFTGNESMIGTLTNVKITSATSLSLKGVLL